MYLFWCQESELQMMLRKDWSTSVLFAVSAKARKAFRNVLHEEHTSGFRAEAMLMASRTLVLQSLRNIRYSILLTRKIMAEIHPTVVIAPRAELSAGVTVGPYTVIENDVFIGPDCDIGAHTVIKQFTRLGARNRVAEHAVLGGLPQDVKFRGETTYLEIGDDNLIREFCTLHRACGENSITRIGARNFLMVGIHIAHNCNIGDDNIFANGVALAGHINVEDHAFLSSNVGCHQFVNIGRYAMVGGKSKIVQDILPFFTTNGNPARVRGLNSVGLRRAGFTAAERRNLKHAYQLLLRSGLSLAEALTQMATLDDVHVNHLIGFIRNSQRGITRRQNPKSGGD